MNTQDKDPRCLGLRADFRGGAQRADAASSPKRPLLPKVHLSDLLPPMSSTLPSQWTAWVREQMGKKMQPPPHSEVQAKPQTGLSQSVQSWLQGKTHLAWLKVASPHSCAHTPPGEARAEAGPSSTPSYPDRWQRPSLHLHNLSPGHCSSLLFGAGWLLEARLVGRFWIRDGNKNQFPVLVTH